MKYLKQNLKNLTILILLVKCVGCINRPVEESNKSDSAKIANNLDSNFVDLNDYIDTSVTGVEKLKISKEKTLIKLTYKLSERNNFDSIKFQHTDFSEIIFPKKSIGLITKTGFIVQRFYLAKNKILILPLIGINNKLQIYYIDLKNGTIDDQDIRTSFELVWINEITQSIYTSNMPEYLDSTLRYKINEYTISSNGLHIERRFDIETKDNLEDSVYKQYEVISKCR